MNFLQLLASGASILNFNFQNKTSQNVEPIPKIAHKHEGFQKFQLHHNQLKTPNQLPNTIVNGEAEIISKMLINERQQLINRYLQLNLLLLEGEVKKQSKSPENVELPSLNTEIQEKSQNEKSQKAENSKKKIKKLVKCGHDEKAHYAKGMCNNCYHKFGRNKKPWNCSHYKLYAGGMCQNCYINMYNKKKRQQGSIGEQDAQIQNELKQETVNGESQKDLQKKKTQN